MCGLCLSALFVIIKLRILECIHITDWQIEEENRIHENQKAIDPVVQSLKVILTCKHIQCTIRSWCLSFIQSPHSLPSSSPRKFKFSIKDITKCLQWQISEKYLILGGAISLIGHSAGGWLARVYMEEFGLSHISLLLTLGTPHLQVLTFYLLC